MTLLGVPVSIYYCVVLIVRLANLGSYKTSFSSSLFAIHAQIEQILNAYKKVEFVCLMYIYQVFA